MAGDFRPAEKRRMAVPPGAEGEVPSPMGRTAFPFRVKTARPPIGQGVGVSPVGTGVAAHRRRRQSALSS